MAKPYVTPVYSAEELASEEWRPIPSVPGYFASSLGRVSRVLADGRRKIRVPSLTQKGYPKLNLPRPVGSRPRRLHHLVAETFLGPRPVDLTVNHRDGDKLNSRPSNLEYITRLENIRHYIEELRPLRPKREWRGGGFGPGNLPPSTKLTADNVREIRRRHASGETQASLAREFGVTDCNVCNLIHRRSWRWVADEAA